MGTRFLVLCALCATALQAQSIAIVAPSAGETLSGWSGSSFTVSVSSAPSVSMVCYTVDADRATNPGFGALSTAGCSTTGSKYALPINTFWWFNGQHQVVATGYDSLGNVVAASSAVTFTIANSWPITCTPALSVTPGTAITSNWSGQVSLAATITGACATDTFQASFYIDGISQGEQIINVTSGSVSQSLDTTQFLNGSHNVGVVLLDTTSGQSYNQGALEWTRTVTFANTATGAEVRSNAREIFLAPSATFTLSPSLVNTDGTLASSPSFYYYDNNTSAATISASSGSSVTVTGVAQGSAPILVMGQTQSGADGTPYSGIQDFFQSASYNVRSSDVGKLLAITGGANCIVGLYLIGATNPSVNFAILNNPQTGASANFATAAGASCTWALGPTRTIYALVDSAQPSVPHFSNSGSILTTYTPGQSMVLNEGFSSLNEFGSQPYSVPFLTSVCNSGFNTMEVGISSTTADGWSGTQAAFAASQASYISGQAALISGCSKLRIFGTGDNLTRSPASLFAVTQGTPSTWSPTGVATVFQSLVNSGLFVGVSWMDEINNWGQNPLQGPIRPGTGTIQNWLTSITAASGTCTATTTTTTPGGKYSIFGPQFSISGSTTSGLNSTTGNLYTLTGIDGTHFTFACSGVANGTYNSSNDPGLTIQDLSAGGWFGSGFVNYDAWASIVNQANSVSGRTLVAGSQAAQTNATAVKCWEGGPCGQSITVGGNAVSNISDWADIYWSHSGSESYLAARQSLSALISDSQLAQAGPEEGYWLRTLYGTYSPTKPLTTISQGTSNDYWYTGYPVAVASCIGNTITFSAPHRITNVIPGVTRLWISGSSEAGCNTNFYVIAAPTATTLTVAYAATTVTCTDTGTGSCGNNNGGTITFQNGDTLPLTEITASGQIEAVLNGNSRFSYSGSASNNVARNRCETFTVAGVTGTGASYFNGTTFYYECENLTQSTTANGVTSAQNNYYRQIPVLNGTGGTASIVVDNYLVKGRNASDFAAGDTDPAFAFGSVIEAMNLRAAGHRFYQFESNPQAYLDHYQSGPPSVNGGWTGSSALSQVVIFQQAPSSGIENQLYSHPNVENSYSVPDWHAASIASMMWTRLAKFYFAVPQNSPDYGPELDCSAYTGSYGTLLICLNGSNGPETRTFSLNSYETSGQNILRYTARYNGIGPVTVIGAGTSTDTLTLHGGDAVFYVFPATFSAEYQAPSIAVRLADVTNATDVVVRYSYDLYNLDSANTSYDCGGTGLCTLPLDKQIGPVYYRIIYRSSSGAVLATSDVETL
jgi:hypothetical protein